MSNRVHTPAIYQSEAAECGAAALCAVFAYYGKHISLETMRRETEISRDGCSAGAIMRAAKKNSLACRGFRKEPEALRSIKTPCILHWEFNHFVVFEGIKGNHAYINDPAIGHRKITLAELDRSFTGVVLTFAPERGFKREKPSKTFRTLIKKQIITDCGVIIRLTSVSLLLIVPTVIIPLLSQVFIDDVLLGKNTDFFPGLIAFLTGSVTLYIVLNIYRSYLLAGFRKKLVLLSTTDFVMKIFSLPISFFEQRYAGDIADKVNSNSRARAFVSNEFTNALLSFLQIAVNLTIMLIYSPEMTAAVLFSMLFSVLVVGVLLRRTQSLALEYRVKGGRFIGALCAGIRISSTVKSCGAEGAYTAKFLGYGAGVFDSKQKLGRLQYVFDSLTDALSLVSEALILILGGMSVIHGRLTVGSLVAFAAVFGALATPMKSLIGLSKRVRIAKVELKRAEDIIDYKGKSNESEEVIPFKGKLFGRVEVQKLSFNHPGSNNSVLSDISFSAECGESVAIVGTSGSGKTTLLKLLCGVYSPTDGCVRYDGINIKNIPKSVRSATVSVVEQGSELFSGTIRDNITLWDKSITENEIKQAAKDACIHDFIIQKPEGYDFVLTEKGANLSGGQCQRIELARALVTNPTVLVLDEATSSLDPIVEKKILENIKRRGCTLITAAHRLSAIRGCDRIIVLNDGKLEELGTHSELIKANGYYKQLFY